MAQGARGTGSAKERNLRYIQKHPEKRLETCRQYRANNPEKVRAAGNKWNRKNRDRCLENGRRYKREHVLEEREYRRLYVSRRIKTDINYRIRHFLRNRIKHALKHVKKSKRTEQLVGCSIDYLRNHIEAQFNYGMSWENHSQHGWHIDHKKPCASFDLSDPEQQEICFHYTNLQPLWAEENRRKRDTICTPM